MRTRIFQKRNQEVAVSLSIRIEKIPVTPTPPWTNGWAPPKSIPLLPRSLSDLGNIGYEPTAAVHFSPFMSPIGGTMRHSKRQKLSSLGSILAIDALRVCEKIKKQKD